MDPKLIEIIVVVEGGCLRDVVSLGTPITYYLLDFDDQSEVVPGTLSDTILAVKEKYL